MGVGEESARTLHILPEERMVTNCRHMPKVTSLDGGRMLRSHAGRNWLGASEFLRSPKDA